MKRLLTFFLEGVVVLLVLYAIGNTIAFIFFKPKKEEDL
jgi:hypothetical protein